MPENTQELQVYKWSVKAPSRLKKFCCEKHQQGNNSWSNGKLQFFLLQTQCFPDKTFLDTYSHIRSPTKNAYKKNVPFPHTHKLHSKTSSHFRSSFFQTFTQNFHSIHLKGFTTVILVILACRPHLHMHPTYCLFNANITDFKCVCKVAKSDYPASSCLYV